MKLIFNKMSKTIKNNCTVENFDSNRIEKGLIFHIARQNFTTNVALANANTYFRYLKKQRLLFNIAAFVFIIDVL